MKREFSTKNRWLVAFGLVNVLAAAMFGCGTNLFTTGQAPNSEESKKGGSSALLPGHDAQTGESFKCGNLKGDGPKLRGLALGLSAVNSNSESISDYQLDCNKDVAIFVHGWSMTGAPMPFANAAEWQQKGFQTLVFRWHDLSSVPDFEKVFVHNSKKAAEIFADALRDLSASLGGLGYRREIRVIGHSFGAKLAAEAVSRVSPITGAEQLPSLNSADPLTVRFVKISRLTLLDPAMFTDWRRGDMAVCPVLRASISEDQSGVEPVTAEVNRIMSLLGLMNRNIKVEVFSTNVGSAFSYGLAHLFPVQTLTRASFLDCFIKFEGLDMAEVHNSVVEGYLGSISEGAPRLADGRRMLSAAVPTAEMNLPKGWYVIETGDPRKDWNNHVFRKKDIPKDFLRLNFGSTCLDAHQGRSECGVSAEFVFQL